MKIYNPFTFRIELSGCKNIYYYPNNKKYPFIHKVVKTKNISLVDDNTDEKNDDNIKWWKDGKLN